MTAILSNTNQFVTRFAPSPTGYMHKGHALAAVTAFRRAAATGGQFLLRIEDIDRTRCRPEYVNAIFEDLKWLGLNWPEPVRRQSDHLRDYQKALEHLDTLGVIYPCFCTRADIQREIAAAPSAPHGPDGPLYPGTCCRDIARSKAAARMATGAPYALRLNLTKAIHHIDTHLVWHDEIHGAIKATPALLGDVVLARKDTPTSYHLSVVVDDAIQKVTHVVRGDDLLHATHIHIVLQKLLAVPTPIYHHHALMTDTNGERLAKRRGSETIRDARMAGVPPQEYLAGLSEQLAGNLV